MKKSVGKLFVLLNFLFITPNAYSLTSIEYLMAMANVNGACGHPVIVITNDLFGDIENITITLDIQSLDGNYNFHPLLHENISLSDTNYFQYLGNVVLDSTDSISSRYFGYRFIFNGFTPVGSTATSISLGIYHNQDLVNNVYSIRKECSSCSTCPSRFSLLMMYNWLSYTLFNSYSFPYSGYEGKYADLPEDKKFSAKCLMNWLINNEAPTINDYVDVLNPLKAGDSKVPSAFCNTPHTNYNSCASQNRLYMFLDLVRNVLTDPGWQINFDAVRMELLNIPAFYCILPNDYFFSLYSTDNGYKLIGIPIHQANLPTVILSIIVEEDVTYSSIGYSYNWQSLNGIIYNGEGVFTYQDGFSGVHGEGFPFPSLTIYSEASTNICDGDSLLLYSTFGSGKFLWSSGDTTSTISVKRSGEYSLTVTDESGCKIASDFHVTVTINELPSADAGLDRSICAGTEVLIGEETGTAGAASLLNYCWTPSSGLNDSSLPSPIAGPSLTTTYILSVTDSLGCKGKDSIIVTVNILPKADAGKDTAIFFGESTMLGSLPAAWSGKPPYHFKWQPALGLDSSSGSNPAAYAQETTTYQLTVTDSNNCNGYDSVVIAVTQNSNIVISSDIQEASDDSLGSVKINLDNISPPYRIIWDDIGNHCYNDVKGFLDTLINNDTLQIDTSAIRISIESSQTLTVRKGLKPGVYSARIIDNNNNTLTVHCNVGSSINYFNDAGISVVKNSISDKRSRNIILSSGAGYTISKSGSEGWGNGNIYFTDKIDATAEASFDFVIPDINSQLAVGLRYSNSDLKDGYDDIIFGLYFNSGVLYNIENGEISIANSNYSANEEFSISIKLSGGGYCPPDPIYIMEAASKNFSKQFTIATTSSFSVKASLNSSYALIKDLSMAKLHSLNRFSLAAARDVSCANPRSGELEVIYNGMMISGSTVIYQWHRINGLFVTPINGQNSPKLTGQPAGDYKVSVTVAVPGGASSYSATSGVYSIGYKAFWRNLTKAITNPPPDYNELKSTDILGRASTINVSENNSDDWIEVKLPNPLSTQKFYNQEIGLRTADYSLHDHDLLVGFTVTQTILSTSPNFQMSSGSWCFYKNANGIRVTSGFLDFRGNDKIRISWTSSNVDFYKNGSLVYSVPVSNVYGHSLQNRLMVDDALYYQNNFSGKVSASFGCLPSDSYLTLKRNVDGGTYCISDKLKFKFIEEYNDVDGNLEYNVYDSDNIPVSGLPLLNSSYGEEFFTINLSGVSSIVTDDFYVLEVKNQKGETFYLRFKKNY